MAIVVVNYFFELFISNVVNESNFADIDGNAADNAVGQFGGYHGLKCLVVNDFVIVKFETVNFIDFTAHKILDVLNR